MTDIPAIMSAAMVRTTLREIEHPGTGKTQTRRLAWRMDCGKRVEWRPSPWQKVKPGDRLWVRENFYQWGRWAKYGKTAAGRQRWRFKAISRHIPDTDAWAPDEVNKEQIARTRASVGYHLRPSIHMPRWASRLTLVVTDVRLQKLQDISTSDAIAEGISAHATAKECRDGGMAWGEVPAGTPDDAIYWLADYTTKGDEDYAITLDPRRSFQALWASIHGNDAWRANPEVVAVTFVPHLANIDQMQEAA